VITLKVVERSEEMSLHVRSRNKLGFMMLRDIRIPMRLHIILGTMAVGMLALVSLFEFHSPWSGVVCVFIGTLTILVYFSIVMELQDPHRSTWFKSESPREWLEEDADVFFEEHHKDA